MFPASRARRRAALLLAALFLAAMFAACGRIDTHSTLPSSLLPEAAHSRAYYTNILGSGKDKWDILVYLNAAGAEDAALASKTLAELLSFEADDHLTVTVEVFGTEDWQGDFVSSLSDRIRISKNGVQTAADTGSAGRGSAAHLSEFVTDTLSGSTANRRALFLWGDNPLSAAELAEALKDAKLDLLALNTQPAHAFEDAYVLRDAADHLIAAASETAVPWDYAGLLAFLEQNPSALVRDLARQVQGGTAAHPVFAAMGREADIFCADLTRIEAVAGELSGLFAESAAGVREGKFLGIAQARAAASLSRTRVSLRAFAGANACAHSAPLVEALDACLTYTSREGLSFSLYLPEGVGADPDFAAALSRYAAAGLSYTEFLPAYLTAAAVQAGVDAGAESWYLAEVAQVYPAADAKYPSEEVPLALSAGQFVLALSEAEAHTVARAQLYAFADTGEHYLLLGESPVTQRDAEGRLWAMAGQDEWLCINAQPVCRFAYVGADGAERFLVPCRRNGAEAQLLVSGAEAAWAITAAGPFSDAQAIAPGDLLEFLYPRYAYDGTPLETAAYGYKVAVSAALQVSAGQVDIGDVFLCCTLTDLTGRQVTGARVNLRNAIMEG